MNINRNHVSPNFDKREIPVEFVVIHYTALPLAETLAHLTDSKSKVSSHLVISENGETYELVNCLNGKCERAWHAGESKWVDAQKEWRAFNDFSIGIELENKNGNLFTYSEAQYQTLKEVLAILKIKYPALSSAQRIIGHEQIAGFRGKCDPGICFDWARLFQESYPGQTSPERVPALDKDDQRALTRLADAAAKDSIFGPLNALLESLLRQRP